MLKPFHNIRVYILTDSNGEWWEYLKTDGSTSRFVAGTAEFKKDKEFNDPDKALKHAQRYGIKRFQVIRHDPPVRPSITWEQTVIHDIGAETPVG